MLGFKQAKACHPKVEREKERKREREKERKREREKERKEKINRD
jgi:hypothetical protein